jgi:hypothetical protein
MLKIMRSGLIRGSPNTMSLFFLVIALAYCMLKGIIYVKKDSSVRLASQFHLDWVIPLPMSN